MIEHELPLYSIENLRAANRGKGNREVDVFRFEYFLEDLERLKAPHRHHFYTFMLMLGGTGSHDIDFRTHQIRSNRLFLISPGQVHAWNELNDVKGYAVMFTDSFVALSKGRKLMNAWPLFRLDQPNYIDLAVEEARAWALEFKTMENELQKPDAFSRDAVFYALGTLLVRTSRLYTASAIPRQRDILFLFQELIEKYFMHKHTPKDYASLLNITPNHLNAIVRKKSGKSAGELIRQRIILEAKRILAHTKLSVAEIAFTLGFEDNSYFGRFFKKAVGLTPEKFRNQWK